MWWTNTLSFSLFRWLPHIGLKRASTSDCIRFDVFLNLAFELHTSFSTRTGLFITAILYSNVLRFPRSFYFQWYYLLSWRTMRPFSFVGRSNKIKVTQACWCRPKRLACGRLCISITYYSGLSYRIVLLSLTKAVRWTWQKFWIQANR